MRIIKYESQNDVWYPTYVRPRTANNMVVSNYSLWMKWASLTMEIKESYYVHEQKSKATPWGFEVNGNVMGNDMLQADKSGLVLLFWFIIIL